jgi:hypothetical protein
MLRSCLALVALLTSVPTVEAQDHPKVLLTLPSGVASETVQIDYFLTGPFGGYGGFVRAERNIASYDIEPFVDGRPADNIKIIAYLPGCEIDTLDLTFSGAPVEHWLDCYPLGWASFRGQLSPASTTRAQSREIEVDYLAMWSHRFFGIADGPVTKIRLGTVRPERDGKFEIALPDFYNQSSLRDGAIQFVLRDPKTGNIIAFLKPAETTPNSPDWLSVQASYPIVRFVAEEHLQQAKP